MVEGVAVFSDLSIDSDGEGFTLVASYKGSSATLTAESTPFDITAPVALETGIVSVDLSSETLTIGGPAVPYEALLRNAETRPLRDVFVQAWIDQGEASRAAGGAGVNCPGDVNPGDLPPGDCIFRFTLLASNNTLGSGTLVPGSATARFELRQSVFEGEGDVLLDTFTMDVTLVGPSGSGAIVDPSGDAGAAGNPDLVSASIVIHQTSVTLQVRFAKGTFSPSTSVAQFLLDMDQNAATGHPGTDAGCQTDAALLGSEYLVTLGSNFFGTEAQILPYAGRCNTFGDATLTGPGSVVFSADGMDITFPRSLIGEVDARLNFKVISARHLEGSAFTGVLDRMTDTGQAPGVVAPQ
jgi:hypothetical protein